MKKITLFLFMMLAAMAVKAQDKMHKFMQEEALASGMTTEMMAELKPQHSPFLPK